MDGSSKIIYTVTDVSNVEQGVGGFVSAVRGKFPNHNIVNIFVVPSSFWLKNIKCRFFSLSFWSVHLRTATEKNNQ